ncbi:MAG: transcription antitermination protein NusB [Mycoplasmataceae bacterium]|nr:transcription antitermination protein NusB [Mycoplasmataceae bacterium]
MPNTKQQWKKRVEIFRFIFSVLMNNNLNAKEIKQMTFENNLFDESQLKVLDYFADHQEEIIDLISKHLVVEWTWKRIPEVDKALLISAYVESKATNIDRKIIIDQALVTIKHFGDPQSIKYINAILDKIIK